MTECLLRLCAHRAADGANCKAPALRQSDYCRHHGRVHRPAVIFPEYVLAAHSRHELMVALRHTVGDLMSGAITTKYGGQILNEIAKRIHTLKLELAEHR